MVAGPDVVSTERRACGPLVPLALCLLVLVDLPAVHGYASRYAPNLGNEMDAASFYNEPAVFPFQNFRQPDRFDIRLKTEPPTSFLDRMQQQQGVNRPRQPPLDRGSPPRHGVTGFPDLTLRQKQFAVHPGMPEFYQENPNFLAFRLQEVEEARQPQEVVDGQEIPDDQEKTQLEAKRARMGTASHLRWDYIEESKENDLYFTVGIAASTAFAVFVLIGTGYCYQRRMRRWKDSEEVEYPSYGVTGPAKDASPAADRKLAQSAQMYHYQHQKSQMLGTGSALGEQSDGGEDSEAEDAEGDYTVYECPGLASTDEMEVKNPLFDYEPTPKP